MKKPGARKINGDPIGNYMRGIPKGVKTISHRGLPDLSGSEIIYEHNGVVVRKVFKK